MKGNTGGGRRGFWGRFGWGITFAALLTAFTAYALLDTFVIPREYAQEELSGAQDVISVTEQAGSGAEAETESAVSNENKSITLEEYRVDETAVYVVRVSGGEISSAFAQGRFGRNIKAETSEIAESVGATVAINGDFYGARNSGYVIRNGTLYRSTPSGAEDLVVWADGSVSVINESEISAEKLLSDGAQQVYSFGPALLVDGEVAVTEEEEVGRAMASNPRTALGVTEDGTYLLVVSDGRTSESEGLSLSQLAQFMREIGAVTAYNLDGGGSSTLYYNGEVINNPTTGGNKIKERSVSDIVYF